MGDVCPGSVFHRLVDPDGSDMRAVGDFLDSALSAGCPCGALCGAEESVAGEIQNTGTIKDKGENKNAMGEEVNFRSAMRGYKREDVWEYVENKKEEIFQLTKNSEEEKKRSQDKIQELERLLRQEEESQKAVMEQLQEENEALKQDNETLKKNLAALEEIVGELREKYKNEEAEKKKIQNKLGREVLRQRAENQELQERLQEAEKNAGTRAEYEEVREVVSEVQYKIAEYVSAINKTQQKLGTMYQRMNAVKKKVAKELEKAESAAAQQEEE